ncbi:MAG TPA: hypothetical protein VGV37_02360 [Aliidongia sp.]|uniref:hypothetical protein n=1 Tax=Aliidongia sp. TaxID=1914230 RepID=UPI002DDD34A4|nr:hypothetical protein [Aliidongia sp.]HEV2673354.1 hypothetical protein [Aliidongia sp.]
MSRGTAIATAGISVLGALALAVTHAPDVTEPVARPAPVDPSAAVRAARRMNRAAGLIAGSVLADSAIEHYRGSFQNKAMVAPLATSFLSLLVSAHGHMDKRPSPHRLRDAIYAAAAVTGLIGTGFHLFNVTKKPGGLSWQNLFYSAPIGAPAALILSGAMGFLSERVRDTTPGTVPTILGIPAGRAVAAATSLGLLGTVGEAGLLHLRGSFQNPFMYLPVTAPPVAAALIGHAAAGATRQPRRITRWWLRLTAVLGFAGAGFHAYGVSRAMGGWRNWRQNLVDGPPIPAPPSFTGLALAGLAALGLMEDHPDD